MGKMDDRKECGFGESDFSVGHPVQHQFSTSHQQLSSPLPVSWSKAHMFAIFFE